MNGRELEIVPTRQISAASTASATVADVRLNGYYGGLRLVKVLSSGLPTTAKPTGSPFQSESSIRYDSTIPRR
jgi:hypothetical protein